MMQVNTTIDEACGASLRRIGSTINSLAASLDTTLYGIITDYRAPKRSSSGKRDYVLVLGIRDPTGYIRMNIFNKELSGLPPVTEQSIGDVIVAKHMRVNFFCNALQGITNQVSEFAIIPKSDPRAMYSTPLLVENDHQIITILQQWVSERIIPEVTTPKHIGRPRIEVQGIIGDIHYFDIILQVVVKYVQTMNRIILYCTDYTLNAKPSMHFLELGMEHLIDSQLVICGTFWDNQAHAVQFYNGGEFILVKNAVKTSNLDHNIEFSLRGTRDPNPNVTLLNENNPNHRSMLQPLLERRAIHERNRAMNTDWGGEQQQQQQPQMMMKQPQVTRQPQSHVYQQPQQINSPRPMSYVMEFDDIRTEVYDINNYGTFEEIFNAEIGSQFSTRAAIIDYKPRNFENWLRKFCSTCNATTNITDLNCTNCNSPQLQSILMFALLIQDTTNNKLLVYGFGEDVDGLFPGVDTRNLTNIDNTVTIIKEYMESASSLKEKRLYLDFGVKSYQVNDRNKSFKLTKTKFVKDF